MAKQVRVPFTLKFLLLPQSTPIPNAQPMAFKICDPVTLFIFMTTFSMKDTFPFVSFIQFSWTIVSLGSYLINMNG